MNLSLSFSHGLIFNMLLVSILMFIVIAGKNLSIKVEYGTTNLILNNKFMLA